MVRPPPSPVMLGHQHDIPTVVRIISRCARHVLPAAPVGGLCRRLIFPDEGIVLQATRVKSACNGGESVND